MNIDWHVFMAHSVHLQIWAWLFCILADYLALLLVTHLSTLSCCTMLELLQLNHATVDHK